MSKAAKSQKKTAAKVTEPAEDSGSLSDDGGAIGEIDYAGAAISAAAKKHARSKKNDSSSESEDREIADEDSDAESDSGSEIQKSP